MTNSAPVSYALMQQWISQKFDEQTIIDQLRSQGLDEASIEQHIREFRKLKNSKKQTTGFIVTGIGSVLGFISCVLTVINPIPELYNTILFGLTSVAILVICAGLYLVFE